MFSSSFFLLCLCKHYILYEEGKDEKKDVIFNDQRVMCLMEVRLQEQRILLASIHPYVTINKVEKERGRKETEPEQEGLKWSTK